MPVGTGGRAEILISGGIDSPVAAWMMAKKRYQAFGGAFCKSALYKCKSRNEGHKAAQRGSKIQRSDTA